ncbi:structural maintenance of chromosomes flexible hinge domain-containing protein 1 isoform X3 [Xyrichtys novacula]|nr:structural maintenance of chromosomes flexible hinge domain-containing protein 1 isoform X3 [Xyrichtys novacula]
MLFDVTLGENAVIILDNGCGMSCTKLKDWATYRLTKFERKDGKFESEQEGYVRPDPVSRHLNSDVSYFGVGGKNAAFFIGESVRMITKPKESPDVHELILSKKRFEEKQKKQEDVYKEHIKIRKPGECTGLDEPFLRSIIREETELAKGSFTAVVITEVKPEYVDFLKKNFDVVPRQLAHIYHYYIHGVNGNIIGRSSSNSDGSVDIQVTMREKPPKCPRAINLKEVENDMQTLYINSAADTFEFRATIPLDDHPVEGILRYHPFLYDRETYPQNFDIIQASHKEADGVSEETESGGVQARGKRALFDCYWNGRLIPRNGDFEFDWCTRPSTGAKLPEECYNRFSGVLFTSSNFKVNTSKLSFVNMEQILKSKDVIFTRVVNGQSQRGIIQREFTNWLQNCYTKHDKQIKFMGYKETIERPEMTPKALQHPWEIFSSIEYDGKIYSKGQLVKSYKTNPILHGTILRFLRHGETQKKKGSVYATGGEVELALEPRALYDTIRVIQISKIDKTATDEALQRQIDSDSKKLPAKLDVSWPEGNPWPHNSEQAAGTLLGPLGVQILNMEGKPMNKMPPADRKGQGKQLDIELKIVKADPRGDRKVHHVIAPHTKTGFYFKKIGNLKELGKYTLYLHAVTHDKHLPDFGGKELPKHELSFTIKEGPAQKFVISELNSAIKVGEPFSVVLKFKDGLDHPAVPPPHLEPVLECSGLVLTFEEVFSSGKIFIIRGVRARGKVGSFQQSKMPYLKVTLPGFPAETQKISPVPGNPHSLHVGPEDDPITVENGNPVRFDVEVRDESGNITANPKQMVHCEVTGLPLETIDCSSTGLGQILTKPINLKITNGEPQMLKAQFEMPNQKNCVAVVRKVKVVPSSRVSRMELTQNDMNLVLKNDEKIDWLAGSVLENLFYKLYDEAGREVPLSQETATKIKVSWIKMVNQEDLTQGKLPNLPVPTQAYRDHFYQVSYQDQSVSVSFHITPRPDEPRKLKATLGQNSVKLGEILHENILLELVDQYNNATATLNPSCVSDIKVGAEGLVQSSIKFTWQENSSSVLVSGVQFQTVTLGSRELCFTYKDFEERVIVKVTAGAPAELKLISGPEMPLQVFSDHAITTPFIVQLYDKWGNPSPDQRVVVELKSSPSTLQVSTPAISQPVDSEGKASFKVTSVHGLKGCYQLEFKGSLSEKPIPGPSVPLTIIPDPKKPVKLQEHFDRSAKFPAGGKFPVFTVSVVSEEGSLITTFSPAAVSMWLWKGTPSVQLHPQMALELKCSKPMENEKTGCFYFRDKDIPKDVGKYNIQFSLRLDQNNVLHSVQIPINVESNQPYKLSPVSQPPNPGVCYCEEVSGRTLVQNMTLMITDKYENPAGQDLYGKVLVFIQNSTEGSGNLPLFEDRTSSCQIDLVRGRAHIDRLMIMENSPGDDNQSYVLLFKPEVPMVPLEPFELTFHFYNNMESRKKTTELSRKKAELLTAITVSKEIFKTHNEILSLQQAKLKDSTEKETILRQRLAKENLISAADANIPAIDRLITERKTKAEQIQKAPRRVCTLRNPFGGQQDVLGMIIHLAVVKDDAAAKVISWHIRGDMDCIVTGSKETAMKIFDSTRGNQQLMPLTGVIVQQGNRQLPHIRNGSLLFNPLGNPVYARELLEYTHQDHASCEKVFKNILGDTILIDDLDSGNSYREQLAKRNILCPTILTRQGERISGRGKFGGAQNRAPSTVSPVFGAPLPEQYDTLQSEIDLLSQYRLHMQKKEEASKEYNWLETKMKSPEKVKQKRDLDENIKQLEEINRQLGRMKRGAEQAGEPSGNSAKRAKQSS